MPMFNPTMISPLIQQAVSESTPIEAPEPIEQAPAPQPAAPAPAPAPMPQPQIIIKPVMVPVPVPAKPKGLRISPEATRKAQSIYPQEQAKKQNMIDNAKAPPTPTGAWGAPQ